MSLNFVDEIERDVTAYLWAGEHNGQDGIHFVVSDGRDHLAIASLNRNGELILPEINKVPAEYFGLKLKKGRMKVFISNSDSEFIYEKKRQPVGILPEEDNNEPIV